MAKSTWHRHFGRIDRLSVAVNRFLIAALAFLLAFYPRIHAEGRSSPLIPMVFSTPITLRGDSGLAKAFRERISGARVSCNGTVIIKLEDDLVDIRHQRFIVRLSSGQTLLVAHNIDLSKRIRKLGEGDRVGLCGEYVWNEKGGIIHKTHDHPWDGSPYGWVVHKMVKYR
jgi:hypothetical protein